VRHTRELSRAAALGSGRAILGRVLQNESFEYIFPFSEEFLMGFMTIFNL
jgi:hypothetical protein